MRRGTAGREQRASASTAPVGSGRSEGTGRAFTGITRLPKPAPRKDAGSRRPRQRDRSRCERLHRARSSGNVAADCAVVFSRPFPRCPRPRRDQRRRCRSARRPIACARSRKSRNRPLPSHSSRKRRSACSTTVAAQRRSKIRSGGRESSVSAETDKCDGASTIQSSQEMKFILPPRFMVALLSST